MVIGLLSVVGIGGSVGVLLPLNLSILAVIH